ncbi:ABC transporter substrate-binding protein [Azospirillum brasilense]|nr:ABC transporter substrate-binding protein [Azospirillum brasilense]
MIRAKLAVTAAVVALGAGLWAGAAQADITIALAGPMTGAAAAYGEQTRAGVEAAVADINAKGGLLGQKLVLTIADDACDAKQAVAAANKLVSQNVAAVIGHVCSGASIAASNVYGEEGIVMISPTATSPQLTDRGLKNVFRVCGRDDQQGEVAAKLIADATKGQKAAIGPAKQADSQGLPPEGRDRRSGHGRTGRPVIGGRRGPA